MNCCKGFEEENSKVGLHQGGFMGKGGLDWALSSKSWRRKKLFQNHTIVIDTELEETLEIFFHLITT